MIEVFATGGDDSATIQAATDAAYAAGGGVLTFPDDAYVLQNSISPRSRVVWDFSGATVTCDCAEPIKQIAGTQFFSGAIRNLRAESQVDTATLLTITSAQCSEFDNIVAAGFDNGGIIKIESAAVTSPDTTIYPFYSSNTIFNRFSHIVSSWCGTGLSIKGHINGSAPDIVVSQNRFEQMQFFGVKSKGIDLICATDTELFDQVLISLGANGAIALDIASDPITGNDYCNSHRFEHLVLSKFAAVTTGTLIKMGWTFANVIRAEHDLGPSSGITELDIGDSQSHDIQIKAIDGTSNLLLETHCKGQRQNVDGDWEMRHNGNTRILSRDAVVCLGGGTEDAAFRALSVNGARNFLQAVPTVAGGGLARLQSVPGSGGDANIDLMLQPFGVGLVRFGTRTATGDAISNGYITIKDASGNLVKLMTRA